jgi:signal transduction histidine kinase
MVASGYLVSQGFYTRAVAVSVREVSIPAVTALASIERERRMGIAYLARSTTSTQDLIAQRQHTDQLVSQLRTAAESALASHFGLGPPESIVARWQRLVGMLDQLPSVRSTVDSRSTTGQQVYKFYNDLLDAATALFDTQARVVPNVTATQGGLAAVAVFRVSDQMSRASSLIDGAFGSRRLDQQTYLEFVRLVTAYHVGLDQVAEHLRPDVRRRLEDIKASQSWRSLSAAENQLVLAGTWRGKVPKELAVGSSQWDILTGQVSDALTELTIAQADEVSAQALSTGNQQLLTAVLLSAFGLAFAMAAIVWAVRQSRILVDRALSVRLARLAADARTIVDERLPDLMRRLGRREQVDLTTELVTPDYGDDEIGQVASVLTRSVQAAAGAAVTEAQTRAAGLVVLMGVARRPQRPLQRGLKIVEDLQHTTGDEKSLAQFFEIHHQLTQTRRFLENLIILAGGQVGRRWTNPLPLSRVLLAAFAETRDYKRIQLRSAPDVTVMGQLVTTTIHLLAELLDNALTFSQPETTVWVSCHRVEHGVAVEIEDAGVGMTPDALAQANDLLATAPTPELTALKDGAQIGFHVVAELAKRSGIMVSLRTSAYGGVLAIVLLPDRILATEPAKQPVAVGAQASAAVAVTPDAESFAAARHGARPQTLTLAPEPTGTPSPGPAVGPNVQADADARGGDTTATGATPAAPAVPTAPPAPTARTTAPALPQRKPQSHLAPGLRRSAPPSPGSAGGASPASAAARPGSSEAAPEKLAARDHMRFARYQKGWAAGQAAQDRDEEANNTDQGRQM